MKIGIDVRPFAKQPAGIGNYIGELIVGLSKIETKEKLFLYSNRDFKIKAPGLNFEKRIIRAPSILWHFFVFLDAKFRAKVDLYFSTHSSLICLFPGLKTVLMVHDLSSIVFPQTHQFKEKLFAGRLFLGLAARRAARIIVPSEFTKKELKRVLKIPPEKIAVIYEGVKDLKIKKGKKFKFPYLLFLGTIEPRKNLINLVLAFEFLKKKENIPHKLVVVGKKGWQTRKTFSIAKKSDLANEVVFTGYLKDEELASVYKNASVFVFPSFYEGFGLPPLEASRLKTLVVASNRSSLPEILNEGAILVNPEDYASIAAGILKALELSVKEKTIIIEKAFVNSQQFTWEKCAQETLDLFRSLGG